MERVRALGYGSARGEGGSAGETAPPPVAFSPSGPSDHLLEASSGYSAKVVLETHLWSRRDWFSCVRGK